MDIQNRIPEQKLAEAINDYFVDIADADEIRHVDEPKKLFKANKNPKHFDLDETSQEEIFIKLVKLSPNKSSGIQNISTSFIKGAMLALISELIHLYNQI